MSTITICEDTFEPSTWQTHEGVNDVCDFLFRHFQGKWPTNAHIYLNHVANNSDITPYDDAGVERLSKVQGSFFVVVYPDGIELIFLIISLVVSAVAIGLSFLLRPSPQSNQQAPGSPNNLSNRTNQARPNGRIPDIFGQLWATADLLSVPYSLFVNNTEIEYCYMCIGRGEYNIEQIDGIYQIRDGITLLSEIDSSVEVYGPNNSPNLGSPFLTIGPSITEPLVNLKRFDGVNGQLLVAPNIGSRIGGFKFVSPNIIQDTISIDWRLGISPNDTLYIGGLSANDDRAVDSAGIKPTVSLGGIYIVSAVTATQITLNSPALVNANWSALAAFGGGQSTSGTANIIANNPFWVGGFASGLTPKPPFFLPYPQLTEIWVNYIAPQGSYKVKNSDGTQVEVDNTIELGITPCDSFGVPTGAEILTTTTLLGSHTDRSGKGVSLKVTVTPGAGGVLVRAHRTSNADVSPTFSNSDQVEWRDLYIISALNVAGDFGDVTTIQTAIKATPNAVAVKDRKLNVLVTRKVPVPSGGTLAPSTNAADIICAMAFDIFIGRLQPAQVDVTEIYNIAGNGGVIQDYFAMFPDSTLSTQFCYTFDDAGTSFEESVNDVATSIFCVAFRRGGVLSLSFEQATLDSTLLFNHRNKVPKSETRTVTFGTNSDNDGIDLDYIEPNAPNYPNLDTKTTLYFPPDLSALNPKKITTIGVRNLSQATVLGWRFYWKLIAQNTAVQFDATEEAALMVLQDRILVADNTRSDTQDGEVLAQLALLLTLSQNVVFDARYNYTIFLQHPDATVENISITAGPLVDQVLLSHAPSVPCVTDIGNYAKTTYMIVNDAPVRQNAFLVSEKTPKDHKIYEVKAVNYDDLYYSHDHDFATDFDIGQVVVEPVVTPPPDEADVAHIVIEVVKI